MIYWLSPDAARQFGNLYSYGTNPLNSVNPDGNEITFSADDAKIINEGLNSISNSSPEAASRIQALRMSDQTINIVLGEKNFAEYSSPIKSFFEFIGLGTPSNVNVSWNPNNWESKAPNVNGETTRPPFIALAHELGHAEEMISGASSDGQWHQNINGRAAPQSEWRSINFENLVRRGVGIPERSGYYTVKK